MDTQQPATGSGDDVRRWRIAQDIFHSLIDTDPDARAQGLAAIGDTQVRRLVADMLHADAAMGTAGRHEPAPAIAALDGWEARDDHALEGQRFGDYQILRLLGRGGMGVVYLAEREQEGVRRQVALKLVRSARFTPAHVRRFLAERRLLARLQHPGIVRLLDLGQHEGMPWYAMDYVDGEPLLAYCDRVQLDLRGRLQVLLGICAALAHAHRSLVLHRDIKPSNVLVDREGRPHLLDFGIAKALDVGEDGAVDETAGQQRFFSPQCAAPEMLGSGPLTTACDTYALGALLYELVSGSGPLRFPGSDWRSIEDTILAQQPLRPSEAVRDLDPDTALATARVRGCGSVAALLARLRGDLDRIALRALAKEPGRRYQTVEAFAEDLTHYLEDRPVTARPDGWSYRLAKFLKRNRWPVALATLSGVALVAVLVLLWRHSVQIAAQRDLAQAEQQRAEQLGVFLVDTFAMADPTRTLGEQITARQLLDQAAQRLDADVGQVAGTVRERLLLSMARAYAGLGLYPPARALAERALAAVKVQDGADPLVGQTRQAAQLALADILLQSGQIAEALPLAEAARADSDEPATRATLARVLQNLKRGEEAEALYRQNLAQAEAEARPPAERAQALLKLARQLRDFRKNAEAQPLLQRALALQRATLPAQHPDIAETLSILASVERELGHGESHPVVGRGYGALGNALMKAGQPAEAAAAMQQALVLVERFNGPDSAVAAMAHYGLGRIQLESLAQPALAEAEFRKALVASERSGGKNSLFFQLGLAAALCELKRPGEAVALLQPLWPPPPHPYEEFPVNRAYLAQQLGDALRQLGRPDEAIPLLHEARHIYASRMGEDNVTVRQADLQLSAARGGDRRIIPVPKTP